MLKAMSKLLAAAACLLYLSLPAHASSNHIPGGPHISNCSKARDPGQCEARLAARTACQHKRGSDKKQCMDARTVAPECSNNKDPVKCSQQLRAEKICAGRQGKTYKKCISNETKKLSARL